MKCSATSAALVALASMTLADIVKIPVARNTAGSVRRRSPKLTKRASLTESLVNNITQGGYFASVSVGTPAQDVTLVLDTGSSDAFVLSADADLCTSTRLQSYYGETCDATFDSDDSSTFKDTKKTFEIQYADGSAAKGTYVTDNFKIGDKTVEDLQMGLATESTIGTGILGVGFELNEAAQTVYPNLVTELVDQGLISTKAFSLYLNDFYSSTGSILFGGVDTDKFIGELAVVPILPDAITGNYSSFTVGLTTVSFAFSNGTTHDASLSDYSGGSLDSVLDSGTTLTYFPDALATEIFEAVGAYIYTSGGYSTGLALVDCSLDFEFTFKINKTATLTVPADELVLDVLYQEAAPDDVPFADICLFGIQNMGDSDEYETADGRTVEIPDFAILGDTFLRSAYVVYDMENLEIGLAPANLNSTTSNVQELDATSPALSSFSGVASQTENSGSSSSSDTSENAAGRGAPAYDGLLAVVGMSLAFAMSGSLLFWL